MEDKTTEQIHSVSRTYALDGDFVGAFIEERKEIAKDGKHRIYSKDRQFSQDKWISATLGEKYPVPSKPWIIFTAGAPAVGKGFTTKKFQDARILPFNTYCAIDPDDFKKVFPEFKGYIEGAGDKTHMESCYCHDIALTRALTQGRNIWLDGTLRNYEIASGRVDKILKTYSNYRIAIVYVTAPIEVAVGRETERGHSTGRYVDHKVISDAINACANSVASLQHKADLTITINNGTEPELESILKIDAYVPPTPEEMKLQLSLVKDRDSTDSMMVNTSSTFQFVDINTLFAEMQEEGDPVLKVTPAQALAERKPWEEEEEVFSL